MAVAGALSDEAEIRWIEETRTLGFDELARTQSERVKRARALLRRAFLQAVAKPNETIRFDINA
eukprot:6915209-Lingulodinium_polyedra.AAC.1